MNEMNSMRALAVKILEADRIGGSDEHKIERLLGALTPDDLATLPGRWVAENGRNLFWEDNFLDMAERLLGLPTKPLHPNSVEMREYERRVDEVIGSDSAAAMKRGLKE